MINLTSNKQQKMSAPHQILDEQHHHHEHRAPSASEGTTSSIDPEVAHQLAALHVREARYVTAGHKFDPVYREKICQWAYNVVDYFEMDRKVVAICMSYLDRFLVQVNCDGKVFRLAALSALFLSIKLHHNKKFQLMNIMALGRGEFQVEHVSAMEQILLHKIKWLLHPPTAACFIRLILDLTASAIPKRVRSKVMKLAMFYSELAVCDSYCISIRPSVIAAVAIFSAMESLEFTSEVYYRLVARHIDLTSCTNEELERVQARLYQLYEHSGAVVHHHHQPCSSVSTTRGSSDRSTATSSSSEQQRLESSASSDESVIGTALTSSSSVDQGQDLTTATSSSSVDNGGGVKHHSPPTVADLSSPVCVSQDSSDLEYERRTSLHRAGSP